MGDLIRSIIRWIIVILIILLIVFLIIKITNKSEAKKNLDSGIKTIKTISGNDGINSNINDDNRSIISDNNNQANNSETNNSTTNNTTTNNTTTNNTTNDNGKTPNNNSTTISVTNTSTESRVGLLGIVILFAGGYYIVRSKKAIEE